MSEDITIMGVKVRRVPPADVTAFHCAKCQDKGYIAYIGDDGCLHSRDCECAARTRSIQRLRRSGLEDLIHAYTFKAFKTPDKWHEQVKENAWRYARNPGRDWFFIAGTPGSGKTHICTAICGQLIARGRDVRYMVWREAVPKLKALLNEAEYEEELAKYLRAPVLYIDDFLKGSVSQADLNLAFTILNHRYNSPGKLTIISSERSLADIRSLDPAIAGRIYERAKDHVFKTPAQDWRIA